MLSFQERQNFFMKLYKKRKEEQQKLIQKEEKKFFKPLLISKIFNVLSYDVVVIVPLFNVIIELITYLCIVFSFNNLKFFFILKKINIKFYTYMLNKTLTNIFLYI